MAARLNVIIGSTRPGRVGPTIGQWVAEAARKHGRFEVELVDLADFELPLLDEAAHPMKQAYEKDTTKRWSASAAAANAFVFVTPEYDFFPPASLINAVQVLSKEWGGKAAGVVSYGGVSGGLRAAQVLRQLIGNVNIHALPQTVPVPFFPQYIGEDGAFRPNEQMEDGLRTMLDAVWTWTSLLRGADEDADAARADAA